MNAAIHTRLETPPTPRMRGRCAWACLLLWALAAPAGASVLYRCTGAAGEAAYVSRTEGYRHCVKLGQFAAPARRQSAPARTAKRDSRSGTRLAGPPPRAVAADPAILKVIPLGKVDSISVRALEPRPVWRPLPVALLDTLGAELLPELLGVAAPPAPPVSTPAPATTTAIPLKLTLAAPKPSRQGAVFRVERKDGSVLYTNVAGLAAGQRAKTLFTYIVECFACDVNSRLDWKHVPLQLTAFSDDVRKAARHSGVEPALLRAVIHAESGFNPRALSYKGAQGLMQLMPATAAELGVRDAFDPGENIGGGARYLATLLRGYHGDVQLAAAAYNAGSNAVTKYGGVPPWAETRVYVQRVALLYQRYRQALDEHADAALATAAATRG